MSVGQITIADIVALRDVMDGRVSARDFKTTLKAWAVERGLEDREALAINSLSLEVVKQFNAYTPTIDASPLAQPLTDLSQEIETLREERDEWKRNAYAETDCRAIIESERDDASGELERLREALRAMLNHSCIADADPSDKDPEDHEAERLARAALGSSQAQTVSLSGLPQAEQEPVWSEWFDWTGGECPIPWANGNGYEVVYRGEIHRTVADAIDWEWWHIKRFRYRLDRAPAGFVLPHVDSALGDDGIPVGPGVAS